MNAIKVASKRVCIIGAGISGLGALKCCLDEGIEPQCYELCGVIGGLWNGDEYAKNLPQSPCLYNSLVVNVSKEFACFSDFPFQPSDPHYPTPKEYFRYLEKYAERFNLYKFITFNSKVLNVEENKTTGKWWVTFVTSESRSTKKEYDHVIVCSGKFGRPQYPTIKGFEKSAFNQVIHSCEFTDSDYSGKNVLVIGAGNTGTDLAVTVSSTANSVALSNRQGSFVLPRNLQNGLPILYMRTRFSMFMESLLPKFILNRIGRNLMEKYLPPKYGFRSDFEPADPASHFVVSNTIKKCLREGKVLAKREISHFEGEMCHFKDGSTFSADVVIFATGYLPHFPFIKDVLPEEPSEMRLYKWIFPINVLHPSSFAVVGLMPESPEGMAPVIEIQARYLAMIIAGWKKLPDKDTMKKSLPKPDPNFVWRMPPYDYGDSLLEEMGAKPSFFKLLLTDPRLAFSYIFGPVISCQSRLVGPHRWVGSREQVLNSPPKCIQAKL